MATTLSSLTSAAAPTQVALFSSGPTARRRFQEDGAPSLTRCAEWPLYAFARLADRSTRLQDTVLKANASFDRRYMFQTPKLDWLASFRAPLYVYYGDEHPQWCESEEGA